MLLVLETTRALTDNTLGTISMVLLWAGVGLVAVGALLLLVATVRGTGDEGFAAGSDGGQPADG